MKRNFLLLVATFLSAEISFAQAPVKQWDYRYGGNADDDLHAMKHTPDGGYILGGSSFSQGNWDKTEDKWGNSDYWIVRLDSFGNKLWDKDFGGTKSDQLVAIDITTDGGFILGGYSESPVSGDKSQVNIGKSDYWIVKTDANGNKQWDKDFGGNGTEYFTSIHQTADGGYILGGYTSSSTSGDVTQQSRGGSDYWIIKTDQNGNKLWDRLFGGESSDYLQSVIPTSDGGYLLAGTSASDISGDKTEERHGREDYWVVKVNQNGIKQWDATYGGDSVDYCTGVIATTDGGFLLCGNSLSNIGFNKSQEGRGFEDYWVVKINSEGVQQWDKTLGGTERDEPTSLLQSQEGGYLIAGSSRSSNSGDKTQVRVMSAEMPFIYQDYWLIKIDENGVYEWDQRFGGSYLDVCNAVVENPDHSFTCAGASSSGADGDKTQTTRGGDDYWIVKTTPTGNVSNTYVRKISPLNYLQGDVISIPYGISGSFNSGNTFYAVLSSNDGTFDISDTIGFVNAKKAGTITATIPINILNGENYRVRVVSSDPAVTSPASESKITVGIYSSVVSDFVYGGNGNDFMSDMLTTADGGFLFGGDIDSHISGDVSQASRGEDDFWILKTDNTYMKEWDARFGGSYGDELTSVEKTTDGGYILGGSSTSGNSGDKTQDNRGGFDYWIIKTNSNGIKQWDARFGGSAYDWLYKVIQTSDGGYLLGGASQSDIDGIGGKSQNNIGLGNDYWIVKTDSNGVKQWDHIYGGDGYDEMTDMISTPDGGYLLFGQSSSQIGYDVTDYSRGGKDFWLVKIDTTGQKVWDRKYGGDDSEYSTKIIAATDGGYILSGSTRSNANGEVSQPNYGLGDDLWIIKIDGDGNKKWDQRLGGSSGDVNGTVIELPDGGYLVGGSSESEASGVKTQNLRGVEGGDYWVVRLDSSRYRIWDTDFGGSYDDELTNIALTPNGNFLLSGYSQSPASGDKTKNNHTSTGSDFWIVEINDPTIIPCDVPSNENADPVTKNSATLHWKVVADAQSYSVRYRKTGTGPWTKVTAPTNSKKLKNLSPNTEYDWILKSVCDQVNGVSSDWCATQNFTTLPLRSGDEEAIISFEIYPNPFSTFTTISFSLEENNDVTIELFDLAGRKIKTVLDENVESGNYDVQLNREQLSAGIYFLKWKSGDQGSMMKIVIE